MKILTLSLLISQKAYNEGKKEIEIIEAVANGLNLSVESIYRFKAAESNIRLSVESMLWLSEYFGVSIDGLINPLYKTSKFKRPAKSGEVS